LFWPANHCHCSGWWQNSPYSRGNCRVRGAQLQRRAHSKLIFFRPPLPLFHQPSTNQHHVSQRDHPLRVRLQPRHSRARPCVRIRAVRLTPHGDGSITNIGLGPRSPSILLPSSPSYVSPPRRRAPSPTSLPYLLAVVAPTTPRPVTRSRLPIVPSPSPPFDRAAGEDIIRIPCCIGRATCHEQQIFWSLTARG
jgi:hypothetical protein